jgi:hypothetical protein
MFPKLDYLFNIALVCAFVYIGLVLVFGLVRFAIGGF